MFDTVYGVNTPQEDVFLTSVEPLLSTLCDGYNVAVVVYGAKATGKTFSLVGPGQGLMPLVEEECFGLIQRSVRSLFNMTSADIEVEFVEVFNEEIRDLLSDNLSSVWLDRDNDGAMTMCGLTSVPCADTSEVLSCLQLGQSLHQQTNNIISEPQSHTVFSLKISQRSVNDLGQAVFKQSRLQFIDLAPSDMVTVPSSGGTNLGLLALGNVISALGDPRRNVSMVPYHDSLLTQVLCQCLGGNCVTLMVCTVSALTQDYEETLNTLMVANRAANIMNNPQPFIVTQDPVAQQQQHILIPQQQQNIISPLPHQQWIHTPDNMMSPPQLLSPIQQQQMMSPPVLQHQHQHHQHEYSNNPFPQSQAPVPYNPVMSPPHAQYRRPSLQSQDMYNNQYNNIISPHQQQQILFPQLTQHQLTSPPHNQHHIMPPLNNQQSVLSPANHHHQQQQLMSPPQHQQQLLSPVKTPLSSTSPLSYKSNTAPLQLYLPQTAAAGSDFASVEIESNPAPIGNQGHLINNNDLLGHNFSIIPSAPDNNFSVRPASQNLLQDGIIDNEEMFKLQFAASQYKALVSSAGELLRSISLSSEVTDKNEIESWICKKEESENAIKKSGAKEQSLDKILEESEEDSEARTEEVSDATTEASDDNSEDSEDCDIDEKLEVHLRAFRQKTNLLIANAEASYVQLFKEEPSLHKQDCTKPDTPVNEANLNSSQVQESLENLKKQHESLKLQLSSEEKQKQELETTVVRDQAIINDLQKQIKQQQKQIEKSLEASKDLEAKQEWLKLEEQRLVSLKLNNSYAGDSKVEEETSFIESCRIDPLDQIESLSSNLDKVRMEVEDLRQIRNLFYSERQKLDEKLSEEGSLSSSDERKFMELDESIEAIDSAIEYKNEIICNKNVSYEKYKGDDLLMKRLVKLNVQETRALLHRYFKRVLDLRMEGKKMEMHIEEVEEQYNDLGKCTRNLNRNLQKSERRLVTQHKEYQSKLNNLTKLAEDNLEKQNLEFTKKLKSLEKELYHYKNMCKEIKKVQDSWKLKSVASINPGYIRNDDTDDIGVDNSRPSSVVSHIQPSHIEMFQRRLAKLHKKMGETSKPTVTREQRKIIIENPISANNSVERKSDKQSRRKK